jgi:hypothetical protein
MMQVIDDIVIIKLEKGESPANAMPMLLRRYENMIRKYAELEAEMAKMKAQQQVEQQRKMSLLYPG